MTEDDYMSVKEALAYLGVTRASLDSYVRQGKISRYKRLGRTMYRRKALEQLREIKQVKQPKPKNK